MRGDYALFFGLWLQKPPQIVAVASSGKPALGIAGERVAHVWRNLPPSQIWAYSQPSPDAREIE
jgi:hypothetical protein